MVEEKSRTINPEEVLQILDKIAKRYANKYRFGLHDIDDIKQQCYLLALDGLKRYNPEKGKLENFLAVHVKRRLLNFKRDETKRVSGINTKTVSLEYDPLLFLKEIDIEAQELYQKILELLPIKLRADFYKIIEGVSIPKYRREKVKNELHKIMAELNHGFE